MTKKDFVLIAKCIAKCYNQNYNLEGTIKYYQYMLHMLPGNFNRNKFESYILERTKPDYIPKEQAKMWSKKKVKNNNL